MYDLACSGCFIEILPQGLCTCSPTCAGNPLPQFSESSSCLRRLLGHQGSCPSQSPSLPTVPYSLPQPHTVSAELRVQTSALGPLHGFPDRPGPCPGGIVAPEALVSSAAAQAVTGEEQRIPPLGLRVLWKQGARATPRPQSGLSSPGFRHHLPLYQPLHVASSWNNSPLLCIW